MIIPQKFLLGIPSMVISPVPKCMGVGKCIHLLAVGRHPPTPRTASLTWAGRSCCNKAGQEKVSKTSPPILQPRQQTAETEARSWEESSWVSVLGPGSPSGALAGDRDQTRAGCAGLLDRVSASEGEHGLQYLAGSHRPGSIPITLENQSGSDSLGTASGNHDEIPAPERAELSFSLPSNGPKGPGSSRSVVFKVWLLIPFSGSGMSKLFSQ